jgi:murein DD-endopeptidase MepM/ murein hydrolase activator NlpD
VKKHTFLFLLILLFSFSAPVLCDETTPAQDKLSNIQSQLVQEKEKLKTTRAQEQRALTGLYLVRQNLNKAKKTLSDAKSRVSNNESKITMLKSQYSESSEKLDRTSKELRNRIVEVYKSGSSNILDLIFSSRSMSDFINRTYYFGRVLSHDAQLIGEIREEISNMRRVKGELESNTTEIKGLVRDIEGAKQRIAAAEIEKARAYSGLKERRKEYERRVAKLEASSNEIERFVRARGTTHTASTGKFMWPVTGRITCPFGWRIHPIFGRRDFHTGLDIASPYGRPIVAADNGEVIFAGWWDGYGKAIVIDHGRGYTTVYGHTSRIYMQAGQKVEKGQVIGLIGTTGFSTGPHLHFEIRVNGRPTDPLPYLR